MWFVDNHGCMLYTHRSYAYCCTYLLALEEERGPAEAERGPVPHLEPQALGADGVLGDDDHHVVALGYLDRLLLAVAAQSSWFVFYTTVANLE